MSKPNLVELIDSELKTAKAKATLTLNDIEIAVRNTFTQCQKEYEEKLRWIPVSEKVPENNKIVEAKLKKDGHPIFFFYKPENKKWYISKIVLGEVDFLLTDLVPVEWRSFFIMHAND